MNTLKTEKCSAGHYYVYENEDSKCGFCIANELKNEIQYKTDMLVNAKNQLTLYSEAIQKLSAIAKMNYNEMELALTEVNNQVGNIRAKIPIPSSSCQSKDEITLMLEQVNNLNKQDTSVLIKELDPKTTGPVIATNAFVPKLFKMLLTFLSPLVIDCGRGFISNNTANVFYSDIDLRKFVTSELLSKEISFFINKDNLEYQLAIVSENYVLKIFDLKNFSPISFYYRTNESDTLSFVQINIDTIPEDKQESILNEFRELLLNNS